MLLLTWHGTILRVDHARGRLTHAPLTPVRPAAQDYVIDTPAKLELPLALPGGITLAAATHPGTVHLSRGGQYLSVPVATIFPAFNAPTAGTTESFLPLTSDQAALLRHVLTLSWATGAAAEDPALTLQLLPGFTLQAGPHLLNLATALPAPQPDGTLLLPLPAEKLPLHPRPAPKKRPEIHLRRNPPPALPAAADLAAFHATPGTSLTLPPSTTLSLPPLMPTLAERAWPLDRAATQPAFGKLNAAMRLAHLQHAVVLLDRGIEGSVLGRAGLHSEPAYLDNIGTTPPPHLVREGSDLFLDAPGLAQAPILRGPHAIFYGGNSFAAFTWLIESVVPLFLLRPYLPAGTTLLLPAHFATMAAAALGSPHMAVLAQFGLDDLPATQVEGHACVAEQLIWADHCALPTLPPAGLRAAADAAIARLGTATPPGQRRLLLVPQAPRNFANRKLIEKSAANLNLELVAQDRLSFADRIALFRGANLIIGSHADLTPILFCAPGTAVLELSAACQFRPRINLLAAKLDLVHAVLPCASAGDSFDGNLTIPPLRLRAALDLLSARAGLPGLAA